MSRESKVPVTPPRSKAPVGFARSSLKEEWVTKTQAKKIYRLKDEQLAMIEPAEIRPNPYNGALLTYKYRLRDITALMKWLKGEPTHLGVIDLTGEDTKPINGEIHHPSAPNQGPPQPLNGVAASTSEFCEEKPGKSIFKTKAQRKYNLSRKQIERIKPFKKTPNCHGGETFHYNECDVKELAEKVELEKEVKRNSPKKSYSPKTPRKSSSKSARNSSVSECEVIVIDD